MISPKVKARLTENRGTGLFAVEPIKKGEVIMVFEGSKISDKEANRLYEKENFDYMLQISSDTFLLLPGDEKFTNHSCNPNGAFLYKNGEMIAIRDIQEGEEISFDYASNEDTEFGFECRCGSASCRKEVGPFHKLSHKQRRAIKDLISPYLRLIYKV